MYDICVLGGGLIGKLIAWRLSLIYKSVILFEKSGKNSNNSATYVAAAMLSPIAESLESTEIITYLGYKSLELWKQWLKQLLANVFFQQNGTLVIWHYNDNYLAQTFINNLNYKNIKEYIIWNKNDLVNNENSLADKFNSGIFLQNEGQLDNRQLLNSLDLSLKHNKVKCVYNTKMCQDMAKKYANWVIDARGIGSQLYWNNLKQSKLRGVRGEIIRVYCPAVKLNRPIRLLHPKHPIYICPKENSYFIVGATQIESEDTSSISLKSTLDLLSALYFVNNDFAEARIIEMNTQLRPTLNHHNPQIMIDEKHKIILVNGLYRHGFLIGPAIVDIVFNYILNNNIESKMKTLVNFIK